MCLVNPWSRIAPYFIILLCLTPDNFTHQGESAATHWVNTWICDLYAQQLDSVTQLVRVLSTLRITEPQVTISAHSGPLRAHFSQLLLIVKDQCIVNCAPIENLFLYNNQLDNTLWLWSIKYLQSTFRIYIYFRDVHWAFSTEKFYGLRNGKFLYSERQFCP
jgi:hypothetical protein